MQTVCSRTYRANESRGSLGMNTCYNAVVPAAGGDPNMDEY